MKQLKMARPHICEWCQQPNAYVGINRVECSNRKCLKYVPFEWSESDDGCDDKNI